METGDLEASPRACHSGKGRWVQANCSDCSLSGFTERCLEQGSLGAHSHLLEPSADSLHSSFTLQDDLACDELLLTDGPAAHQTSGRTGCLPGRGAVPRLASRSSGQASCTLEVADQLGNEMRREAEVQPCGSYLERHSSGTGGITTEMRSVAVSWLVEVVGEFKLQQETLFLGVTYLDRFLSVSQAVPKNMLQLVAVTCISLASKQEEVEQPTASEWTDISDNCFKREDLVRMEWLVIDSLGWRGRIPTQYSFLHLFCYGLSNCSFATICMASYVAELSMLDYSLLEFPYSVLAAAALVVGHASSHSRLEAQRLAQLAPGLDLVMVRTCAARLAQLQHAVANPSSQPQPQGVAPIRAKYSQAEWGNVALAPALDIHQLLQQEVMQHCC